jgi:hypothetical protein
VQLIAFSVATLNWIYDQIHVPAALTPGMNPWFTLEAWKRSFNTYQNCLINILFLVTRLKSCSYNQNKDFFSEVPGSHVFLYENCCLLGCDFVWCGRNVTRYILSIIKMVLFHQAVRRHILEVSLSILSNRLHK